MASKAQTPISGQDGPVLQLTEQEDILCQLLHNTCQWIESEKPALPQDAEATADSNPLVILEQANWRCEARIAGGWVRDKLLSSGSDDLDISLSTLTGYHFALYLKAYITSEAFKNSTLAQIGHVPGLSNGCSVPAWSLGTISKIEANPEQSKNLETATAMVMGLSLDFVNLRKEVYESESRIPTMTFGTPTEDAERRDITINTMFFNVHTRRVEDFTGKGLRDLKAGIVRTPLPPLTTFLDDPLRILRCIRFASRFSYTLHASIQNCLKGLPSAPEDGDGDVAMKDPVIAGDPRLAHLTQGDDVQQQLKNAKDMLKHALQTKISRERFGIEVDKMLKGRDPLLALQLLHELGLFEDVFHPPPTCGPLFEPQSSVTPSAELIPWMTTLNAAQMQNSEASSSHVALNTAKALDYLQGSITGQSPVLRPGRSSSLTELPAAARDALHKIPTELLEPLQDSEQRRRLFYAAALLPLRHKVCKEKKKFVLAAEKVLMEGLKLGAKQTKDPVICLFTALDLLAALSGDMLRGNAEPPIKDLWPQTASEDARLLLLLRRPSITNVQLQLSVRAAFLFAFISELLQMRDETAAHGNPSKFEILEQCWQRVKSQGLEARLTEKVLLNGEEIKEVLGFPPVAMTPRIQTAILAWQFDRSPAQAKAEECKKWLKECWDAGQIIPVEERTVKGGVGGKAKGAKGGGKAVPKEKGEPAEEPRSKRQKSE